MKKNEENTILWINNMRVIMDILLGPFLTAYFIKTSKNSIPSISYYNILVYIVCMIGTYFTAKIIKNKFRIESFRLGVFIRFIYILLIIILKEKIIKHLLLIAIFSGLSTAIYWFPYNLFVINKINNKNRTKFTVKNETMAATINIIFPILFGTIISKTNFELTTLIILGISIIQVLLSFFIINDKEDKFPSFNINKTIKLIKNNKEIKNLLLAQFLFGMTTYGSLEKLKTILIIQSLKTNLNLGIITSLATVLSIITIKIYSKIYKEKNDKNIILLSSILPVISVFIIFFIKNPFTIILYNIFYIVFTTLLHLTTNIRLFNISDSKIIDKNNQCEFFTLREIILNIGRILGFIIMYLVSKTNNELLLNSNLLLLTVLIVLIGLLVRKVKKYEE